VSKHIFLLPAISTYSIVEKFIPGRFLVPERTLLRRGTFVSRPGTSRSIREMLVTLVETWMHRAGRI